MAPISGQLRELQAEIRRVHAATGEVLDPHTAIGTKT